MCIRDRSYSARLKRLHTDTLELRRLLNDLVMVYKILNYHVALNAEELFYCNSASNMLTRGHSQRLFKPLSRIDCRKYSFVCRCISAWNSLPQFVIDSPTISSFKVHIRSCDFAQFLTVCD